MTKIKVLVDMSATLLHHGHVRLLKQASSLGSVTIGLCADQEILKFKGFIPELRFEERKEILLSIRYVDDVIESPWIITDEFMDLHSMDLLVHGDDNSNLVATRKLTVLSRTPGISSSDLRVRANLAMNQIKEWKRRNKT
jgi:cytidyltransferase-like protein